MWRKREELRDRDSRETDNDGGLRGSLHSGSQSLKGTCCEGRLWREVGLQRHLDGRNGCRFAVGCGEATKKIEWAVAVRRCSVEGCRGWLASCGIVVFSGLRQCGFQNLEAAVPCNRH